MDAIREMLAERVGELEAEMRSHKAAMEGMQAERDAMAAHVERLREAVEFCNEHHHFGCWTELLDETPATSLAKLKAQWQAEALELAHSRVVLAVEAETVRCHLRNIARKLRQQAQEPTPNGSD